MKTTEDPINPKKKMGKTRWQKRIPIHLKHPEKSLGEVCEGIKAIVKKSEVTPSSSAYGGCLLW